MALAALNGAAIGSRDNQMQASAVTGFGLLTITKVVTGGPTTYPQTDFTVSVNCTETKGQKPNQPGFPKTVTIGYPSPGSATVSQIPLPSICTVTEPTLPSAPAGYTWGAPVITGSPVTLDGDVTSATVTVTNPLTRDTGSLQISKVFDPLTSGFGGTFAIDYDCDDGTAHDGTVNLAAGGSQTISGIPTGTTCVVSESTPTPPTGWTFGAPTLSDSQAPTTDGTVVITTKGATYTVTVTNTIIKLPTIIVRKITTGTAGGPFTFTTTGGNGFTTPFDLTTVTPGVAVQQSFLIGAAGIGGNYSVTEGVTAGFVLTDVSCAVTVAGVTGTTVGSDLPSKTGSITNLTAGTTVTCTFMNSGALTTRTQGFWATHLSLVQLVWSASPQTVGGITTDGMTNAEMTICPTGSPYLVGPLTVEQVMGGFWSNIAKTSTGAKRIQIDQARMQLLQQLLASILNNQLFGSSPTGMTIDQAKAAYCSGTIQQIKAAQSAMASFNESGDSGLFTPGASANPKDAKAIADYVFWDVLP
ncbi:MAG: hypothetical protein C0498_10505 [Anaerolinea sp.]|nr:hypothetical protein [Anaerolinea sp.]